MNKKSLTLSIIATTLISGVVIVYAWTGPSASPFNNNVTVPINAGATAQTKSGAFTAGGLGSAGSLIVTGNSTLGGGYVPRAALDVNGNIITNAGYAGVATSYYDVLADKIGAATSVYSYGSICTGTSVGNCTGSGSNGVVLGGTNTGAYTNFPGTGPSFVSGNLGINRKTSQRGTLDVISNSTDNTAAYFDSATNPNTATSNYGARIYSNFNNASVTGSNRGLSIFNGIGSAGSLTGTNYSLEISNVPTGTISNANAAINFSSGPGAGGSVTNNYGIVGSASPAGTVSASNYGLSINSNPTATGVVSGSNVAGTFTASPAGQIGTNNYGLTVTASPSGTSGTSAGHINVGAYVYTAPTGTLSGPNYGGLFYGRVGNGGVTGGPNYGLLIDTTVLNGATVNGHNYGLYLLNTPQASATITGNNYGLYINSTAPAGVAGTTYGIYQNGNFYNYFGGNTGIGVAPDPVSKLKVAGVIESSSGGFEFPDGSIQTTAAGGQWSTSANNIFNTNTGNVGIGTGVNPVTKLDVNGSINIVSNGNLTWGGAFGPGVPTIAGALNAGLYFYPTGNTSAANVIINSTGLTATNIAANNIGIGTAGYTNTKLSVNSGAGNSPLVAIGPNANLYIDYAGGGLNYLRGNTYFNGLLVDENNSGYYLDPSSLTALNNATISGTLGITGVTTAGTINASGPVTATAFVNSGTGNTKTYQNVYNYKLGGASYTGTMKIVLPKARSSTMLRITINGYDYAASTGAWQATIGGYTYGTTQAWANTSQEISGRAPFSSVRLAYEGSNAVILLGDTSTVWRYPSISVSEVMATHSGVNDWEAGWVASITTDESAVTVPVTPPTATNASYIANQNASAQTANAWISGTFTANGTVTGSGGVLANGPGGGSWLQYSNGNNYLRGNTFLGGILYDENNSTYYVDPASTSNFNVLNSQAQNVTGNISFGTVRSGAVGVYDPSNTQALWSMGPSYLLPAGGASNNYGNFYGLGWSYDPNYGGAGNNPQSKAGLSHQLLIMMAGTTRTAIGNGIWSNGIIHSATGGFRFPDGTTQTTAATAVVPGNFIQNQNASAQTANAWISGTLRADGLVTAAGSLQVNGAANIYSGAGNTHFGYAGGTTNYLRGTATYFNGSLIDENNGAYYLNPDGTSIMNDLRANIIYDQGNTAYYLDSASTSNLNSVYTQALYTSGGISDSAGVRMDSAGGWLRTYGSTGWYNGTHAGGWYMTDSTWIRSYGGKSIYQDAGITRTDGTLQVGSGGATLNAPNGGTVTIGTALTVTNAVTASSLNVSGSVVAGNNGDFAGNVRSGGFDFIFGNTNQTTRGNSGASRALVKNSGSVLVINYAGDFTGGVQVQSALTTTGNVTAPAFIYSSDKNLKENINPLNNSLDNLVKLNGYSFNWKNNGRADIGVIAQEVEKVFPSLVHTDSATGLKSVEYGNLVAPIIEAIKELATRVEGLAGRVFNAETRLDALEKQNQLQADQIRELQRQILEIKETK